MSFVSPIALSFSLTLSGALSPLVTESEPVRARPAPAIVDGSDATVCQWPTVMATVSHLGGCTGTLIHPRVLLYAAHCSTVQQIYAGERILEGIEIIPEECQTYPELIPNQTDFAACKLAEPLPLPITPIVYGECEMELARAASEGAIVGFGSAMSYGPDPSSGPKRWAMAPIREISDRTVTTSGEGTPVACSGDSGGPVLVRFPDQSWHVLGVASTVEFSSVCTGPARYSLAAGAVEWIEGWTGLDVTPCWDGDVWSPTDACADFFSGDADQAAGSWAGTQWCEGSPSVRYPAHCGAPAVEDEVAPTVVITAPEDASHYPSPISIEVLVDASDDLGPVDQVDLIVDEVAVAQAQGGPSFRFPEVALGEGLHTIRAVAVDQAGNEGRDSIEVGVGEVVVGSDSSSSGATDSESDPELSGDEQGCACASSPGPRGLSWVGALVGLAFVARRRARA